MLRVSSTPCVLPERKLVQQRSVVKARRCQKISCSAMPDMVELSATIGKGLTLWVMFTSGLNYFMYRRINRKYNDNDKNK